MKLILASPHGFCAGVVMAIESVERALRLLGPPLYVYHEIVHNRHVVERLSRQGVWFVADVDDVPEESVLLFSAHGVSPDVRSAALRRRLRTIDATCPLVAKVHSEVIRYARLGYSIVLIGHAGHDEVVGTIGEAPDKVLLVQSLEDVERLEVEDGERIVYVTQTTLSVDDANEIIEALKLRFPRIIGPGKDDICYATQNRQAAVRELVAEADLALIVGSANSSNSLRLVEVAAASGIPAYLVDEANDLEHSWFRGIDDVLLTAGASAPQDVVDECVAWICERFDAEVVRRIVREEAMHFAVPVELR